MTRRRLAWSPILVAGLTALAFGLRVATLDHQSLWYDEAFSVLLALRSVTQLIASTAQDTLPPLYYLVLHAWLTLGGGDFWWRFPSAWFGTLAVPLTFAVGRRLLGPSAGVGGAFLITLSPFQLFFSQEARVYAVLTVLALLLVYGYARGVREGGWRPWALVAASGAAGVYTHPFAWLLVGSLAVLRVWDLRRMALHRIDMPVATCAIGFAYLPWAGVALRQVELVRGSFWAGPPTLLSPLASLHLFLFGPFLTPLQTALGLFVVLFVLGLGLTASRIVWKEPQARSVLTIVMVWLWGPLLLALLASQVRPVYLERTLIGSSPALFLLLAWALTLIRPRPVAWLLAAAAESLLLAALVHAIVDPAYQRPPYRDAAHAVAAGWRPGDGVLHTGDGSYLPFLLYLPDIAQDLLAGDPEHLTNTSRAQSTLRAIGAIPVTGEQAAQGHRRMWLVVAPDHSADFQRAAAVAFGQGKTLVREHDFRGIVLRLYE